jgi:hypothetical protein
LEDCRSALVAVVKGRSSRAIAGVFEGSVDMKVSMLWIGGDLFLGRLATVSPLQPSVRALFALIACTFLGVSPHECQARGVNNDYDGDGITDLCVWRPSTGTWYVVTSSGRMPPGGNWFEVKDQNGTPIPRQFYKQWGLPGDTVIPGDFNHDGITDLCVIRPGYLNWYIAYSNGATQTIQFGLPGDTFAVCDWDGDDNDDMFLYRPSTTYLWWRSSSTGVASQWASFAANNDVSIQAVSHFKRLGSPGTRGHFKRYLTPTGQQHVSWDMQFHAQAPADREYVDMALSHSGVPVFGGDYDGNGESDFVYWVSGTWTILNTLGTTTVTWGGTPGDIPIAGDFDGDGKSDLAIWNSISGQWWVFGSGYNQGFRPPHMTNMGGGVFYAQWGLNGDVLPLY